MNTLTNKACLNKSNNGLECHSPAFSYVHSIGIVSLTGLNDPVVEVFVHVFLTCIL